MTYAQLETLTVTNPSEPPPTPRVIAKLSELIADVSEVSCLLIAEMLALEEGQVALSRPDILATIEA